MQRNKMNNVILSYENPLSFRDAQRRVASVDVAVASCNLLRIKHSAATNIDADLGITLAGPCISARPCPLNVKVSTAKGEETMPNG